MNNHPRGAQLTRLPSRPRIRLRRTQTAHNLDASIKKSFEVSNKGRTPENGLNMVTASDTRRNRVTSVSDTKNSPNASSKESPSRASLSQAYGIKNTSNINHGCAASSSNLSKTPENFPSSSECTDSTTNHASISIPENRHVSDQETNIPNSPLQEKQQPQNSSISTSSDLLPINRFRIGRRASTISRTEQRQREAMWDLFQSENAFLIDHLMVIKHVSSNKSFICDEITQCIEADYISTVFPKIQIHIKFSAHKVYMEPLKKVQVEGFLMYAEPEVLFGNLDELCSVSTISFCRLQIIHSMTLS